MILVFEDKGQDALKWTISELGIVTKTEPFQTELWKGTKIIDFNKLQVGDKPMILTPQMEKDEDEPDRMFYKIKEIK